MDDAAKKLPEPWREPWPSDGLETLGSCPVCGEGRRTLLYTNLGDNVFRVAPGKWQLWRCGGCGSAYLDPRPTPESIHIAYKNYYTHRDPEGREEYDILSPLRKLRRRLVNGYTNWRYSTQAQPASALGIAAAFAVPPLRHVIDRQYRHLPCPPQSGGRVLDVGCGDGYFLRLAHSCGWDVMGVDPDPKAGSNSQGFAVRRGGTECLDEVSELFDAVTLNHVIEHVHNPVEVLRHCRRLLKPGGQVWLETPNIDSLGHTRFQRCWLHLDPPRHLVLFNQRSIVRALEMAGFRENARRARPDPSRSTFSQSRALEQGIPPFAPHNPVKAMRRIACWSALPALLSPRRREFLTFSATA